MIALKNDSEREVTVLQPRLIREDDTVPAVSHMHSFAHKCRRGGRFYKSSDIIAIDFTTLMRKTTTPPTFCAYDLLLGQVSSPRISLGRTTVARIDDQNLPPPSSMIIIP